MDYSELIEELVKLFDANEEEKNSIETIILEAYDLGYYQGQEDAELMYLYD